jgi:hypothetical protein
LKVARELWQVVFKGKPIRITTEFSADFQKGRRAWTDVCQVLQENISQLIVQ